MTRIAVDLAKSYRLINHGPTVLVSSAHGGKRNVMAAAWSMPLDFAPPKVSVVIDKHTWTRELVEASGSFALNVPCRAFARQTLAVGQSSGREQGGDKFAAMGLETFDASEIEAPLLAGCVAWLECRVIPEPHNQQAYDLFIGEVVAAHADARVFAQGRWRADVPQELRSIHYVAGGAFFATGEGFEVG
ncbi:MAG: flavin reductase family protein [Aquabacterium sp.]|jgi:flavin reductase (DIM6/NTAB) family NADH-FMN oxidoreductase RutF|nr:MAG: flavin reductase family protein [Aquabacterium sp.]